MAVVQQGAMSADSRTGRAAPAKRSRWKKAGSRVLSLVLLIAVWWGVSLYLSDNVLPSPLLTVQTMFKDIGKGDVFGHLGITLSRVLFSFILSMICGTIIGCLLGLSRAFREFFSFWVVIGLSVPALVYIVVVFLWLGLSEFSAILAASATTVFSITVNIRQGVDSIDRKLLEMSAVFKAGRWLTLRKVILPQLYPYLMGSARVSLGLIWKMVIFVELMGRSDGIGYMINYWYQLFNMSHVLGYALVFILVMLAIEVILSSVVEPRLFAWRPRKSHE